MIFILVFLVNFFVKIKFICLLEDMDFMFVFKKCLVGIFFVFKKKGIDEVIIVLGLWIIKIWW